MSDNTSPHINIPNRRILDKHFVSQVVTQPVKEFRISAGSKQGDNVMGTLLCLDVRTEKNEIYNLVIKSVLPMTGVIDKNVLSNSKFIASMGAYDTEACYYKVIRPIYLDIMKGSTKSAIFTGPVFYSNYSDGDEGLNDYLALEDLRPIGFKMVDKFKGLNYEELTAAMKQLAIFHAVSYAALNGPTKSAKFLELLRDPKSKPNIHGWGLTEEECGFDNKGFYNSLMGKVIQFIREKGQHAVADKIQKYSVEGYDMLLNLWKATEDNNKYFRVLIHGDLWTNNILFKHAPDGKTVEDVKFIDYQGIRFGNIYEELHYFIFTSTTAELRKDHLSGSFQVYYDEFTAVLRDLKCEMPNNFTVASMMATFLENLDYGYSYNMVALPFQLGLAPPPPSPMTPVEFSKGGGDGEEKKFFANDESKSSSPHVINASEFKPNFREMMEDMENGLMEGVKNSPIGQQRLMEMVDEMIEFIDL